MLKIMAEGATKYDFKDDKTGRPVQGINIYYMVEKNTDTAVGRVPQKISISDLSQWEAIKYIKFPSEVEVLTEQVLGSKGIYNKTIGIKPVKSL